MNTFKPPLFRLPKHGRFEYRPRYYDLDNEEKDENKKNKRITFRTENHSKFFERGLAGQIGRHRYIHRHRQSRMQRLKKMILLIAIGAAIYSYYIYDLNILLTLGIILILLVFFIREINKI